MLERMRLGLGTVEEFSLCQTLLGAFRNAYENLLRCTYGRTGESDDGSGVSFGDVDCVEHMESTVVPIIIDSIQLLLLTATETYLPPEASVIIFSVMFVIRVRGQH